MTILKNNLIITRKQKHTTSRLYSQRSLTLTQQQSKNGISGLTLDSWTEDHNVSTDQAGWKQWLAGLIDGDGSLLVSKEGYCSCEITMALRDAKALMFVKSKLGGSVKLRAGVKAFRYRLHNKSGMLALVDCINGNIRTKARILQLKAVCQKLNILFKEASVLTLDNNWFIGYFDADGTITAKFMCESPSITISISSKLKANLEPFLLLKGNIYYTPSGYGYYIWSIQSRQEILNFVNYAKKCVSRSGKAHRLSLVKTFYELKDTDAHKLYAGVNKNVDNQNALGDLAVSGYKAWISLHENWCNYKN